MNDTLLKNLHKRQAVACLPPRGWPDGDKSYLVSKVHCEPYEIAIITEALLKCMHLLGINEDGDMPPELFRKWRELDHSLLPRVFPDFKK